jgi:hypothetical protein
MRISASLKMLSLKTLQYCDYKPHVSETNVVRYCVLNERYLEAKRKLLQFFSFCSDTYMGFMNLEDSLDVCGLY